MCGGLGGMTITWLATTLSKHIGFERGILLVVVLALFTILFYVVAFRAIED
jgi:hypothetical protein